MNLLYRHAKIHLNVYIGPDCLTLWRLWTTMSPARFVLESHAFEFNNNSNNSIFQCLKWVYSFVLDHIHSCFELRVVSDLRATGLSPRHWPSGNSAVVALWGIQPSSSVTQNTSVSDRDSGAIGKLELIRIVVNKPNRGAMEIGQFFQESSCGTNQGQKKDNQMLGIYAAEVKRAPGQKAGIPGARDYLAPVAPQARCADLLQNTTKYRNKHSTPVERRVHWPCGTYHMCSCPFLSWRLLSCLVHPFSQRLEYFIICIKAVLMCHERDHAQVFLDRSPHQACVSESWASLKVCCVSHILCSCTMPHC